MFVFTMHIKTKQTLAVCSHLFKNPFKVGRIVKKKFIYSIFSLEHSTKMPKQKSLIYIFFLNKNFKVFYVLK